MTGWRLRLYDAAGAYVTDLPDVTTASCQDELNGDGGWSAELPRHGEGAELLRDAEDGQVGIVYGGVELMRGLLEDDTDREDDPARPLVVGGRGTLALLERALVYPAGGAGTTPATQEFTAATAGAILVPLLTQAQARGGLPGVTWTFTATHDSAGVPWAAVVSTTYDAGVNYRQVVDSLVGLGVAEVRMVGTELRAYVPDTELGRDRPDVVLTLGKDVTELERARSRRELASHVLVLGDAGANRERANPTTAATWSRREVAVSQGNTTEAATMALIGDAELERRKQPAHGRTVQYDAAGDSPLPFLNYRVGDRIRLAHVRTADGSELEPLRVRTSAVELTAEGMTAPTVELADVFLEAAVRLSRRIDGIVNGTVVAAAGGGGADPAERDTVAPAAPSTVALTTEAYVDDNGTARGVTLASWPQVTTNADGTACTDLAHYAVRWTVGGRVYAEGITQGTTASLETAPGATVTATVRAVDQAGNSSAGTVSASIVVADDAVAPPTPSAPAVTDLLNGIRYVYDGLGAAGEAMPADLADVEVHVVAGPLVEPTDATLIDHLLGGGAGIHTSEAYGTQLYVRLVAVDRSGNRSAPSAAGSAAPRQVELGDLPDRLLTGAKLVAGAVSAVELAGGAVTAAKLAADAVTGPAIAAGAITATKIGDDAIETRHLVASAVTAAELAAGAVVAGKIAAGAVTTAALAAGSIVSDKIAAGAITTATLAAGAVTATELAANAVVAAKIAAGAISVTHLAAGTLSATNITAGTLQADVLLAARLRTAASGARVELNSTGLEAFNSAGQRTVFVSAASGAATFVGKVATAFSGPRVELTNADPVYGNRGIVFYPTSTTLGAPGRVVTMDSIDAAGYDSHSTVLYSGRRSDVATESYVALAARGGVTVSGGFDSSTGTYKAPVEIFASAIRLWTDEDADFGDYDKQWRTWFWYEVTRLQQNSYGQVGEHRGWNYTNSNNRLREWERRRISLSRSNAAYAQGTMTWAGFWSSRPVATATHETATTLVANDAVMLFSNDVTSVSLRAHDVNATVRTLTVDVSVMAWL